MMGAIGVPAGILSVTLRPRLFPLRQFRLDRGNDRRKDDEIGTFAGFLAAP